MERIWTKNYDAGVPKDINIDPSVSINTIVENSCKKFKNLPSFTNFGATLSFGELDDLSKSFASFLQNKFNLKKGERFAVMLPNTLQYPIAMFGILRAGGIVVNVNPMYTASELEHQLKDSGVTGIVVLENFVYTLEKILDSTNIKNIIITQLGDLLGFPKKQLMNFVVKYVKKMVPKWNIKNYYNFTEVLNTGKNLNYTNPKVTGSDIAFLQYTGGTTGRSKGAILTHSNLVANLEQASSWLKSSVEEGKEIIITALPLYHIFSLTANCLTFMKSGSLNVLITNPRDVKSFVKEISKYKFTTITGVNTLFNLLLENKEFQNLDFSSLKIALGGGMAVQYSVAKRWENLTKRPLLEAYGLTETSPAVCMNPMSLKEYNGSIGLPIPSTEISIRDDNNQELDFGEMGELWVRGPQVMRGYWKNNSETSNVLTEDGWLRTGDIAIIEPSGFVKIVDRKKDMIVISGFNVYPTEIEDVISKLDEVLEVAVVGISDSIKGEQVKAYIVPNKKSKDKISVNTVIEHCREYLTAYKVPKIIEFREELPKSNVGKILRRALK